MCAAVFFRQIMNGNRQRMGGVMVVKRVAPMSVAKVAATLYAILGLIFGGIISVISFAGQALMPASEDGGMMGMLFGVAAVVILPIFYACLGFVLSLLMTALYNLAAGWVGGIEVDVA
jgi:hypothetical protein